MRANIFITLCLVICSCSLNKQKQIAKYFTGEIAESDSLKSNIESSYRVWRKMPWASLYDKDIFINFVVPPQIADEPIEYYWREDIPTWLKITYCGEDLSSFARAINSEIDIDTRADSWGNRQMGYSTTMLGKFGKCDDRAILAAMAMRSYGIPAAFDFTPIWGSGNNGHSFCSVLSPDGRLLVFQDRNDKGTEQHFSHKVSKIYRKTFFENTETIVYQNKNYESIPFPFSDYKIKDVTQDYKIGFENINIEFEITTSNSIGYLGTFHPSGWFPIAYGLIKDNTINFSAIGTGLNSEGETTLKGDDIGRGIIYLPFIYEKQIIPIDYPFILSDRGIRKLVPSTETEQVLLKRKYPRLQRIRKFARYLTGTVIEGANLKDFSDAKLIHRIYSVPLSRMQPIYIDSDLAFQYIRIRKPSGIFSIAGLIAFNDKGEEISGEPLIPDIMQNIEDVDHIYDNDPLTYFEISSAIDIWVGLDFGTPQKISAIGVCPRNDDNDISPGDIYELLYWDNSWKSLEKKKATGYEIKFENVPKGALLWLRDLTKGKEERPFTYENGKQVWW